MLELLRNGQLHKNTPFEPVGFFAQQLILVGPLAAPVWLLGILSGLTRRDRPTAVLSVTFLATVALMFLGKAKAYYVGPAYPTVLALGAVELEARIRRPVLRWATVAVVAVAGSSVAADVHPDPSGGHVAPLPGGAALHAGAGREARLQPAAPAPGGRVRLAGHRRRPRVGVSPAHTRGAAHRRHLHLQLWRGGGARAPRARAWPADGRLRSQPVLAVGAARVDPRPAPGHRWLGEGPLARLPRGDGGRPDAGGSRTRCRTRATGRSTCAGGARPTRWRPGPRRSTSSERASADDRPRRRESEQDRRAHQEQSPEPSQGPEPRRAPGLHQPAGDDRRRGRDRELQGDERRCQDAELHRHRRSRTHELGKHRTEEEDRLRIRPDQEQPAAERTDPGRPGAGLRRRWLCPSRAGRRARRGRRLPRAGSRPGARVPGTVRRRPRPSPWPPSPRCPGRCRAPSEAWPGPRARWRARRWRAWSGRE